MLDELPRGTNQKFAIWRSDMNKNKFSVTPPMGWNSYDYYDTMVNEEQVKANADYMAAHLKEYGWEYIIIDIEWYSYDTGTHRPVSVYSFLEDGDG
jgi:hypothetical protein